jgi:lipoate-protein ligase A
MIERVSFRDAGVASGAFHMYADAETLDLLQANPVDKLAVRVFQWDKPTVSFGYLLGTETVRDWIRAMNIGDLDLVKRPTGGGAVLHSLSDVSFSLAWRRDQKFFSDRPRDCYAQIHERLLGALQSGDQNQMDLFTKSAGSCESPRANGALPVCFNEPVCNDVMAGDKKVIGGALRITKNALLYQGTVQLPGAAAPVIRDAIRRAFA